METGIYQEVEKVLQYARARKRNAAADGINSDKKYWKGKCRGIQEALWRLEAHGLRYDEHGASGRRDGSASREHQAEDAGGGIAQRNVWDSRWRKLLIYGVEEAIITIEEALQLLDSIKQNN